MMSFRRSLPFVLVLLLLAPVVALATTARFDLDTPSGGPFPSDVFTVADPGQNTGVRVNLPKPACAARPSDCEDIDVLNTLDGFNAQPRISIPFNGPIDPASVSSANVFLVSLGSTLGGRGGKVVGINQIAWEPAARTLHVESDEFLDQHTRYVLVVTNRLRDPDGNRVNAGQFNAFLLRSNLTAARAAYRQELLAALAQAGVDVNSVIAASVFTTQSVSAVLEKIRGQIKAATPAAATMHATFPRSTVVSIDWHRQVGTAPTFANSPVPIFLLNPLAVGAIAFGKFESPDYETPLKFIPPVATRTGVPAVQTTNTLQFTLILPTSPAPAGGYPVVIFGHGFTDSKQGAPIAVAGTLASHGLASIAINVVGHGGGGLGTLTVNRTPPLSSVSIPDGGRGIDQDGNGTIDSTEGVSATVPIISNRDGLRQTVVDLMQLVRLIQTGGIPGLSHTRIYYAGQSFGGIYGTILLGVEPDIRAGVPNVPGGPIVEIARLSPSFRVLVALALGARTPSLLNAPPFAAPTWGFDENMPLRDEAVRIDTVAGASAIQEYVDNVEWTSQSGNPVAYAPFIRRSPLTGDGTPVIYQFAKGDRTVPNPTTTALIRAGDLNDRTSYMRHDLNVGFTTANPHTFLTFGVGPTAALLAQEQIAIFLASDGAVTVDPDGLGPLFEVPINGPLSEGLNF
ncbi:MAG TPA: hypothetical protein VE932_14280 [Patescibacteria group bacterium]|nr:hypothetical protein [Patescibacteria group bacterium]